VAADRHAGRGAVAAASAHALNCVVGRGHRRQDEAHPGPPLAQAQVPKAHALVFGLVLGALSALWLGLTTNWLAAALSVTAIAFYVLSTPAVEAATSQNIVWVARRAACRW